MRFADGFPGPAKSVQGGLKARSTRGAIGDTWWSKAFLGALERLADGGRLQRGRAYARKGQVVSMQLSAGVVTAVVQGSRDEPYQVRIAYAAVPSPVWRRIEDRLAAQARYAAHLLAGQVPHELVDVFEAEGVDLFPAATRDLDLECSCPDWGWPCKHVAAACYLLAEAFDADPFELLRWRGRDREELLGRLRKLRGAAEPPAKPAVAAPTIGTRAALGAMPPAAGASPAVPAQWWTPPSPIPAEIPADRPDVPVLRQLPVPSAYLGGEGLSQELAELYRRLDAPEV
ncbi:SWIM zinc finger family protein [Hamadaea tsunoensis]|uniref:SWIM zinc finger family protein n=1 Tax=Hamadaea tsunoensis TaxID=53368 RepID=UPI0004122C92|nr:SWIM zinc finger family protein [Hamadaea tsunoensis]